MCVIVYNYSIQTSEGQFWMKLFNKGIKTTSFTHEKTKLSRMHPGSTGAACPPCNIQSMKNRIDSMRLNGKSYGEHISYCIVLPYLCCETYVKVIGFFFFWLLLSNGPRIHVNKKHVMVADSRNRPFQKLRWSAHKNHHIKYVIRQFCY